MANVKKNQNAYDDRIKKINFTLNEKIDKLEKNQNDQFTEIKHQIKSLGDLIFQNLSK